MANVITLTRHCFPRLASRRAAANPMLPAMIDVRLPTSKLFLSKSQFIKGSPEEKLIELRGGGFQFSKQSVPIYFQCRRGDFGQVNAFKCLGLNQALCELRALEIIKDYLG